MLQKNVLLVLPTAVLGGAERVMQNLAHYLLQQGYSVTLYAMCRGDQVGWDSLKSNARFNFIARDFKSEKTSILSAAWNVWRLCKKRRMDYVVSSHSHVNAMLSTMRYIGALKTEFLISRESTFIFNRFFGWKRAIFFLLYKLFYGAQDLLICQTPGMRDSLVFALGFFPVKKIEVISNPVNIEMIDRQKSSAGALRVGSVNIVACGRLMPIKGFDRLIAAFSRVWPLYPNARLTILGAGGEMEKLKGLIESMNLTDAVRLVGAVQNPAAWFAHADIGVISSEREGFPNVLLEMMASGVKRLVSTPCTDGVLHIPNIVISDGIDSNAIEASLVASLGDASDHSAMYRRYVEEHNSLHSFWADVNRHLGGQVG